MNIGFFFRYVSLVYKGLHIGVVHGSMDQLAVIKVVYPRVPCVHPMAVATRIDQECCQRAVRLLFCRNSGELDNNVRLFNNLLEHGLRVIGSRRVALKELLGGHHHLIRRFAPAASASHTIGDYSQHTAGMAWVTKQADLILLIVPVTFVDTRGRCNSITFGHRVIVQARRGLFVRAIDVLSDEAVRMEKNTLNLNLHSPERQLIELKIQHADLNALADMTALTLPIDELLLRRLKKRRLLLRDQISRLELSLFPSEPA